MDPALALRGFVLGFTIAAAVGPISLLVIRRTLAQGQLYGLVSGLGVATADATYGAIAAFGLSAITDVPSSTRDRSSAWSAASSCCGSRGGRSVPPRPRRRPSRPRAAGMPVPTSRSSGLTLTNPMTILSFGALFAGLGVTSGATGDAALVVVGVLLGSTTWWIVLTTAVATLRRRDHADLDPPDQPRLGRRHRGVRDRGDRLGVLWVTGGRTFSRQVARPRTVSVAARRVPRGGRSRSPTVSAWLRR